MKIKNLDFKTIDLEKHGDLCVTFRKDAYIVSFGSDKNFYEHNGKGVERYLEDCRKRVKANPASCVHVWKGNEIIGQVELELWYKNPSVGYIDLFYLVPEYRGKGYGDVLEDYAESYFRKIGCRRLLLSVSPTNIQAVRFYKKHGWNDCGPRKDFPEVNYMEKNL
jgi:ribosomal protein S18 acetylase RimI-like enzyme